VITDLGRLGEWVTSTETSLRRLRPRSRRGTTFSQNLAAAGTPFAVDWVAVEVGLWVPSILAAGAFWMTAVAKRT
jgi:hypothetical protein